MTKAPPTESAILIKLRKICFALPGVIEVEAWGHPNFKVNGKTFAVLETYKGTLSLAVKVEPIEKDKLLTSEQFYNTPYIGSKGWISLKLDQHHPDWNLIEDLVTQSYLLVPSKRTRKRPEPSP
jgi:predicted DNA-binding protein (MmcQ/YjbR family)